MLYSRTCDPNCATTWITWVKCRAPIILRKSVTTSCRHWNADRMRMSVCSRWIAPIILRQRGHDSFKCWPMRRRIDSVHSSCFWRTSANPIELNSHRGWRITSRVLLSDPLTCCCWVDVDVLVVVVVLLVVAYLKLNVARIMLHSESTHHSRYFVLECLEAHRRCKVTFCQKSWNRERFDSEVS